ncbi:hypothetical protein CFP56_000376, partial [Quercus suber]
MSPSAFLMLVMVMALAITRATPCENDSFLNDEIHEANVQQEALQKPQQQMQERDFLCSLMLFFVLVNLMALFITLSATTSNNEQFLNEDDETQEAISLRGTSRFLAQKNARVVMTCDKYPRVCRAKGSPGEIVVRRNTDSIVGSVGRNVSTQRFVAK